MQLLLVQAVLPHVALLAPPWQNRLQGEERLTNAHQPTGIGRVYLEGQQDDDLAGGGDLHELRIGLQLDIRDLHP